MWGVGVGSWHTAVAGELGELAGPSTRGVRCELRGVSCELISLLERILSLLERIGFLVRKDCSNCSNCSNLFM